VLSRTSNPSAGRLQDLAVDGMPLHERVARWVADQWPGGRVGLVVGATVPQELERLRGAVPGPAFLVPGVGAQGGDLAVSVGACAGTWAPGLVSVSRGIASASRGADWREAAAGAAGLLRSRMREAVLHSMASAARRPITEA
jgi:orotidine-5'-phosphate decarboxylase